MKMIRALLSLVAIFFFTSSFAQVIEAEKPVLAPTEFKLDSLPDSEIDIPIQVNLKPIYAMAEKNVDLVFTSPNYPNDWVQPSCDTRYKYSFRRSPLQMSGNKNLMTLGFTGYYKIIGSTRACVSGTAVSPWTPECKCGFDEAERRVNVAFYNAFALQPDYKLKLIVMRGEPQPLDKCEVCFWGQDITKQVLNGLKAELDVSKNDIEKKYGTVDLKARFQQVWDMLNKSFNLYEQGWLQINPTKLRVNGLFIRNDSLNISLGLSARPIVRLNKPNDKSSWVPNISQFSGNKGFNIFLDAQLNYDSLSHLLNAQIKGKEFSFKKGFIKKRFVFTECKLLGSNNERLIIEVNFEGTDKGTIYLTGKPVYDPKKHLLDIQDIDFDLRSRDALLKTADWLFNKKITNEIAQYARYDLNAFIDSSKVGINAQLNSSWVPGITGHGFVNDIQLIGVYPLNQHLVVRVNCNGDLAVTVDKLELSL